MTELAFERGGDQRFDHLLRGSRHQVEDVDDGCADFHVLENRQTIVD